MRMRYWSKLLPALALLAAPFVTAAQPANDKTKTTEQATPPPLVIDLTGSLQDRLDTVQTKDAGAPGFALTVIDDDQYSGAVSGQAAPDGRAMRGLAPFRIASVTKTFVAAAVLRLHEMGRLDLDASIDGLISEAHHETLSGDGYDTSAITVRHLLMHAGGLADHAQSDKFLEMVLTEPDRQWTRSAQIALMASTSDPLSLPGEQFHYSDTGYVLLGEIIERVTGQSLPAAVRELNRFEALGLEAMRWEGEASAPGLNARAHQYYGGQDITFIDGSMDAFGGGGLIATTSQMALYFRALFSGHVFEKPETLDLMLNAPGHPAGSPYRLGLFVTVVDGHTVYSHSGFWGVYAGHVPSLNLTLAGVSLDEQGERSMRGLLREVLIDRAAR